MIGPTLYLPMFTHHFGKTVLLLFAAPQQPSGPNGPDWIGPMESTFEGWEIDCCSNPVAVNISGNGHRKVSGHVKKKDAGQKSPKMICWTCPSLFLGLPFWKRNRQVPSGHLSYIYHASLKKGFPKPRKIKILSNFNFLCKVWVIFHHPFNNLRL